MDLCNKNLPVRGKYKDISEKKCYLTLGHSGACSEFPYLKELKDGHPRVANKIVRDATKTTGAAWKSVDAGPNRIDRWIMLESDAVLKNYGIDMDVLKPSVIAKLREKSATYDDCMEVSAKLTWLTYQMTEAPVCSEDTRQYLEARLGSMSNNSTTCIVCKEPLNFTLFEKAQRGRAEIETAHSSPRLHNEENVGFAHRECNIAQGNRTLEEFYQWADGILNRAYRN